MTKKIKKYYRNSGFSVYKLVFFILLSLYSVIFISLLLWGFIKSLHGFDDFIAGGMKASSWPGVFSLENYIKAFENIKITTPRNVGGRTVYFAEMIFNSVFYSVGCATVSTMTSCIVAYLTVKHKFWFNKVINFIYFFTLMVPILGAMPATIRTTEMLGLRNTWIGMFIMRMTFTGGTSFLLYQAAFRSLDDGYKEAAVIDGASHLQVMVQIMFPMIRTIILTFFMMGFISYWNDYTIPMVYLQANPTASYGLYALDKSQGQGLGFVTIRVAGFMLLILPTFTLFLLFKDKLMGNLTEGGIKG